MNRQQMLEKVENLSAYEVKDRRFVEEMNSEGMVLEHRKSGARLFLMSNEDDNKVFSIGFRTPPADSTGLPHILEHSVLEGSEKFPVKDPFVELVKGSLNTFLNAMTYPDKTVYPVASCNDKDFQNLMDVYLDGVFHPSIYREPKIFKQEGWHYELESEDAQWLEETLIHLGLSIRAWQRLLKVARTIADIDQSDIITRQHLQEAVSYRAIDRLLIHLQKLLT